MRALPVIFSLCFGLLSPGVVSLAEETPVSPAVSAFGALGLLPPGVSKRIAIIEGRDGSPQPERWYLVAYDPTQEHRLMEYVVASNRVVAVHPVSQFAQELSPEDILPLDFILMDSDRVLQMVEQFARINNLKLPKINLRLKKEGVGAAPLWKITCMDDSASPFAGMLVAAQGGTVLQTSGFQLSPDSFSPPPLQPPKPEPAVLAVAQTEEPRPVEPKVNPKKKQGGTQAASPQKRNRAKAESRRQSKPEPVAEGGVGFFQSVRNLFQRPG